MGTNQFGVSVICGFVLFFADGPNLSSTRQFLGSQLEVSVGRLTLIGNSNVESSLEQISKKYE